MFWLTKFKINYTIITHFNQIALMSLPETQPESSDNNILPVEVNNHLIDILPEGQISLRRKVINQILSESKGELPTIDLAKHVIALELHAIALGLNMHHDIMYCSLMHRLNKLPEYETLANKVIKRFLLERESKEEPLTPCLVEGMIESELYALLPAEVSDFLKNKKCGAGVIIEILLESKGEPPTIELAEVRTRFMRVMPLLAKACKRGYREDGWEALLLAIEEKEKLPLHVNLTQFEEYTKYVKYIVCHYFKAPRVFDDRKRDKIHLYDINDAILILNKLGQGIDFSNEIKAGFRYHLDCYYEHLSSYPTHIELDRAIEIQEKLGQGIDFTDEIKIYCLECIESFLNNKGACDHYIYRFFKIKEIWKDDIDFTEEFKKITLGDPGTFIQYANRNDWKSVFGEKVINNFLNILPKQGDEKRNAFTHNKYDRTTEFLGYLARNNEEYFALDADGFEIITQFVDKFDLSKTSILFHYFRNIQLLQKGLIKELPEEQTKDGITTIEELESRYKNLKQMVYGDEPMVDLSKLGLFEVDLLSSITGKSTHSFDGGRSSIGQIIADFQKDYQEGEIAPLSPEYQSETIKVKKVTIEFDAENIKDDYQILCKEVLSSIDEPGDIESLKTQTISSFEHKINELQKIAEKNPSNQFIQKQLNQFQELKEQIFELKDLDNLMDILLNVDRKTVEKYNLTSVMRQIIFRKIFQKHYSPEMLNNLVSTLRGDISGQSILALINIVDVFAKDHVLSLKDGNKKKYWDQETWNKIKDAKSDNKLVNLLKIFAPHINNLKEEARNFELQETGNNMNIRVVPDRGFIGEMSGYLANACYTAEYPLLKQCSNLTPNKFIAGKEKLNNLELFGSDLIFELESAWGEKVMLVRAFNVPQEHIIDIGAFIENRLDCLEKVAWEKGIHKIIIPGDPGAISNYPMTINHMQKNYIKNKQPISLKEKFAFNGPQHDLTNNCYVAREVKIEQKIKKFLARFSVKRLFQKPAPPRHDQDIQPLRRAS